MKGFVSLFLFSILVLSCSSKKVAYVKETMKYPQQVNGNTKIGVEKGDLVVQEKWNIAQELRQLQYDVYGLEDNVFGNKKYGSLGLYGVYRQCHIDLAKPENGGNGNVRWIEPMDPVIKDEKKGGIISLDNRNKIVKIKKEFLKERIKRFTQYKETLQTKQQEYRRKVEECELKLKMQKKKM